MSGFRPESGGLGLVSGVGGGVRYSGDIKVVWRLEVSWWCLIELMCLSIYLLSIVSKC